jgi:hypothetical protein
MIESSLCFLVGQVFLLWIIDRIVEIFWPVVETAWSYFQSSLPILVFVIAIVSYRYTVRANVRSAISEVPPIVLDEYALTPTVNSVRWRPYWGRRFGVSWSPRTSLQIVVYERDGDKRRPSDARDFGQKMSLHNQDGDTIQQTLERRLGVDYNLDEAHIQGVYLYRSGINISCYTNKPDQLQNVIKAVLRYYGLPNDEHSR